LPAAFRLQLSFHKAAALAILNPIVSSAIDKGEGRSATDTVSISGACMIRCVEGYFVLLARLTLAKRVRGLYQLRVSSRSPRVGRPNDMKTTRRGVLGGGDPLLKHSDRPSC
jgi:hypothetical protein